MDIEQKLRDELDLERGRAIDAFAKLESTLCQILVGLGNLSYQTASTIFYSNISLQPRIEIISALIKEASGDTFNQFWSSVCKIISSLNKQRNKIVHWHSYPVFDGKQDFKHTECILIHPIIKNEDNKKVSEVAIHSIQEFSKQATYVSQVLSRFRLCFDNSMPMLQKSDVIKFSSNILKYPPPENDPFLS
jgi:hypothetical protein